MVFVYAYYTATNANGRVADFHRFLTTEYVVREVGIVNSGTRLFIIKSTTGHDTVIAIQNRGHMEQIRLGDGVLAD